MTDFDAMAAPTRKRQHDHPERATVRRATDTRVYVTLDRQGDRREYACRYTPQVILDGDALVKVAPPAGVRAVVLFPGGGAGGAVAVWLEPYT